MPGTPHPDAARARLAAAEAQLIAALVTGAPAPADFDSGRLRVQRAALIAKRRDGVTRVRPELSQVLGPRFSALFHAYATTRPKPAHGGSTADGQAFVQYLAAHGRLPEQIMSPRPGTRLRRLVRHLSSRR